MQLQFEAFQLGQHDVWHHGPIGRGGAPLGGYPGPSGARWSAGASPGWAPGQAAGTRARDWPDTTPGSRMGRAAWTCSSQRTPAMRERDTSCSSRRSRRRSIACGRPSPPRVLLRTGPIRCCGWPRRGQELSKWFGSTQKLGKGHGEITAARYASQVSKLDAAGWSFGRKTPSNNRLAEHQQGDAVHSLERLAQIQQSSWVPIQSRAVVRQLKADLFEDLGRKVNKSLRTVWRRNSC